MGIVVPLQREKFEGVNAEDWPYTTETPENDTTFCDERSYIK